MSDEIDRAQEREAADRESAIRAARTGMVELENDGACHNCGEMTDIFFCCRECRDDWQARRDAQKRNGGAG